ncbi:MAG: hypothetical protein M1822_006786 [Bathelium mastoideum]|nr:MAG: hypothetical protein M1822_006786 [Bathelium mastoideum]
MASRILNKGPLGGPHSAGIYADMTVDGEEIGTLVVVVDRAKNLPNRKTMGKQDPYCAARLGKEAKKTETDKRGGQTPRWDQELRFTVHESPDYYNLKVSVFNDDKRTDLIGETWVSLEEVVVPGGGKGDKWHSLNCKGKYAGEIRIELTYYDTRVSSEQQISDGLTASARIGTAASSAAGPRQQPPVRRRPLPTDPNLNHSSPTSTPDRATPIASFGPRSYVTQPNQRPLPASNSSLGFAIRDKPNSSPAGLQQDHYQPSEPSAHHGAQYDSRSNYGYDENAQNEYSTQREPSPYTQQYEDDGRSIHPSEHSWSEPLDWQHQQQHARPAHPELPLPHSYSAPSVTGSSDDYYGARHSIAEPYQRSEYGDDHNSGWSREQRRSPQAHSMQPTVEDEPSGPPPPPAHRKSAPTLPNYRSNPNLNSSTEMRAYAAQRHRMSLAENSPHNSPMAHSPYGNQASSHDVTSQTHLPQQPAFSTPASMSRDMLSHDSSPQPSPLSYQRPHYSPVEATPSPLALRGREATPNSVPLIKPRPISPATQPSPVSGPLRQSLPPATNTAHSTPTRKSVSPHPTPTRKSVSPHPTPPGAGQTPNRTPFSPDSFDAFNPTLHSPSPNATSSATGQPDPIRTPSGHLIDPSDHLPTASWAPEPERKGGPAASELGAQQRANRPSPRGAQPMITVRTRIGGGGASMPVNVTRKQHVPQAQLPQLQQPQHVAQNHQLAAGEFVQRERSEVLGVRPNPPPPPTIPASIVDPAEGRGGRNRLVKKSRPGAVPAAPAAPAAAPMAGTLVRMPMSDLRYEATDQLQHYSSYQQQVQPYARDYDYPPDEHAGGYYAPYPQEPQPYPAHDATAYGNPAAGYRGGRAPPIPAKIPLQPYVSDAEPHAQVDYGSAAEMAALSEEMKSIDIGPGSGGRGGGRMRRGRFGA